MEYPIEQHRIQGSQRSKGKGGRSKKTERRLSINPRWGCKVLCIQSCYQSTCFSSGVVPKVSVAERFKSASEL